MNYPALCFWLLIAWSVTASRGTVLVLLVASMPFASLALLPPEMVRISILPQRRCSLRRRRPISAWRSWDWFTRRIGSGEPHSRRPLAGVDSWGSSSWAWLRLPWCYFF